MKLFYPISVPATGAVELTATTFYILITEIGGLPDPDYFTGGAASE